MEVRARALAEHRNELWMEEDIKKEGLSSSMTNDLSSSHNKPKFIRKIKHEIHEMTRVTCTVLRCQASKLTYLFIPAFISIFWILICLITTRSPNVTLEERYVKVMEV